MEMKTFVYSILIILTISTIFHIINTPKQESFINQPTNYQALVFAGLAPSAPSRAVTDKDIDTGLRAKLPTGQIVGLYESRNWNTLDYGKTFVSTA